MATVSQTHRAFFGLGRLVRDNNPPIQVRYDVVVTSRPADAFAEVDPTEQQWEWDKAEGFVTLVNHSDVGLIEPNQAYTLLLADGRRCRPALSHDRDKSLTRFLITCPPNDLVDGDRGGE
jgi:hypothetical protein